MIKGQFAVIPAKVLKDKRLSDKQLRLLCVLAAYTNANDGYCYPSINRLADDCGCTRLSIIRNMDALIALGYVCKVRTYSGKNNGNTANLYYLHYDVEPEINPDEVIRVIHNPSITSDTTPSIINDTTLVSPVIPKQYKENKIPFPKEKNNRACAQFANENEKEKLSEGDRQVFSDWYSAIQNEIGQNNAEKAINALEIKKNKQKIMLIVPTLFLEGFLNELGFFDAYDKLDSVFADKGIELVKRAGIAGIDIKQQVMEG